ncbi:MAG: Mu-like prophage major head subunit gpT family protein [Planctomycetota bacterium]
MPGTLKGLGSRAIIGAFFKRLEEAMTASWVSRLASQYDSNQEVETYTFASDSPTLKELGNSPTKRTLKTFELSLRNRVYQNILEIKEDDMRRDKTGQIMARVNERAARAAQLPQSLLTALLLNANGKAYDKKNFFASDHRNENGDTIDNAISHTVAAANQLTTQEGIDVALKAIEQIVGFLDDEGEPRNEFARQFTIMCPINLHTGLLSATRNEFSGNGASNTLRNSDYQISVIMNPRLTAEDQLFVFRSDSDVRALLWQDEVPTQFAERNPQNSDIGFLNDVHLFKAKRVCAAGYGRYDQAVRVTLTT